MNQSISDKGVFRTAPSIPGLLITCGWGVYLYLKSQPSEVGTAHIDICNDDPAMLNGWFWKDIIGTNQEKSSFFFRTNQNS